MYQSKGGGRTYLSSNSGGNLRSFLLERRMEMEKKKCLIDFFNQPSTANRPLI